MSLEVSILGIVLALLIGAGAGVALGRQLMAGKVREAQTLARGQEEQAAERSKELIDNARKDAERITKDAELRAKDEFFQKRDQFNKETDSQRTELRELERKLQKREDVVEARQKDVVKKDKTLDAAQKKLTEKKEIMDRQAVKLEEMIREEMDRLTNLSGLSREQAEKLLLERLERNMTEEIVARLQRHEEKFKAESEQKAREILASSIQRYAAPHTAEARELFPKAPRFRFGPTSTSGRRSRLRWPTRSARWPCCRSECADAGCGSRCAHAAQHRAHCRR